MRFGELGDGGCGLPRALCALAMTWVLQGVRCKAGRRGGGTPPLQRGNKRCSGAGRCGERTERCQWQKQRSERVAAVKISSVRRKAAQKFWAPQQGHRPLRKRILWCVGEGLCPSVGATARVAPTEGCKRCGGAGRCGHRPLRKRILWCVGEGLCPSRGRPQGSPLRRVIRGAVG